MRKIYTGIDIGSDSIKIVVSEVIQNKYYVLASTCVKSRGVKKGLITDKEKVSESINKALNDIEATIGIKINEAIVTVPSNDRELSVVSGSCNIVGNEVIGEDIVSALSASVEGRISDGYELITTIPIVFKLDDVENIMNPIGKHGSVLEVKAVMVTVPRENLFTVLEVCNMCNIKAKDVIFGTIGDYYESRGKDTERELGAIINIGSETTNVSIFNKGIIIKDDIINLGSKNVDKDILYTYGVPLETARDLKENFSVCSRKYADSNDQIEVEKIDKEIIKINQYELSEVVEARVSELLKLAKKSIISLTNRKISYIIVTGGIAELTGFGYVVENVLGINASTLNITTLGIRSNKYSSSIGIIKYFHEKLKNRGIEYSMLDQTEINKLLSSKRNSLNIGSDTIVDKIKGYFTNN